MYIWVCHLLNIQWWSMKSYRSSSDVEYKNMIIKILQQAQTGWPGFKSQQGQGFWSLSPCPDWLCCPSSLLFSGAKYKNVWIYAFTLPYVFLAWCLIKHRDYLTFYHTKCISAQRIHIKKFEYLHCEISLAWKYGDCCLHRLTIKEMARSFDLRIHFQEPHVDVGILRFFCKVF